MLKQSTLFGTVIRSSANKKTENKNEICLLNSKNGNEHDDKQHLDLDLSVELQDAGNVKNAIAPLQNRLVETNSEDFIKKNNLSQAQTESAKKDTAPTKPGKKSLSLSSGKRASNSKVKLKKPHLSSNALCDLSSTTHDKSNGTDNEDKVAEQTSTILSELSVIDVPVKKKNAPKMSTQPTSHNQHSSTNEITQVKQQVKNSIGYEDFLAQFSPQSKMKEKDEETCQKQEVRQKREDCADKILETEEENINRKEEKKSMSYSEFLGLFKSPAKNESFQPPDEKDEEDGITDETERSKNIKCKSITSYFSKTVCKTVPDKKNTSTTSSKVTVVAEVHSHSVKRKKKEMQEPAKKKDQVQKGHKTGNSSSDEDAIIFLSSETITDVDTGKKSKSLSTKKRKMDDSSEAKEELKKQKMERDIMDKNTQEPKQVVIGLDSDQSNSLVQSSLSLPAVGAVAKSKNSSQSTLSFGKTGLSLTKAENRVCDSPVTSNITGGDSPEVPECLDSNSGKRVSKRTRVAKAELTKKDNKESDIDIRYCSPASNKRGKTNKRDGKNLKESGASLEPTAPLSTGDGTSTDRNANCEGTSVETPLRRSTRITRSTQSANDVEVVEVESDLEENTGNETLRKKRGKKEVASDAQFAKDGSTKKTSKKSSGMLAPIFTLVKSKEEEVKQTQPLEDPEKVRLRREFLMSGVPEELKRQIITPTNSTVVLDYPPFPQISHVQQLTDSAEETVDLKNLLQDSDEFDENLIQNLIWGKLEWNRTVAYDVHAESLFQKFKSHPTLSESQINILLKELCESDRKFPFKEIYNNMRAKMNSDDVTGQGTSEPGLKSHDLKSRPENDVVILVDDTSPVSQRMEIISALDLKACLWPDLHQPDRSEHIIGNSKVMKKLKVWLEDWKAIMQKEARKANRASSKGKGKGSCWSDDSDFTDSEEEELRLCNTVLVTGKHGVGKTSSVYALAQELGYKVFEVNSSTLRSGKQLMAQLEEATQSHRVTQSKSKSGPAGLLGTPPPGMSKNEKSTTETSNKKSKSVATPMASAFANLFKTPASGAKPPNSKSAKVLPCPQMKNSKLPESKTGRVDNKLQVEDIDVGKGSKSKEGNKVKKMKKKEKSNSSKVKDIIEAELCPDKDALAVSGSLNLASSSLILVDEVDVVFDEDKGFLATVQHFMTSTKIPIILTSTDASFHIQLSARHDHVVFKQPPLVSATSFLCTVCLAHGVRVSRESISRVLTFMEGDIRRCLLYLQFWCESGGGIHQTTRDVNFKSEPIFSTTASSDLCKPDNIEHPEKNHFSRIVQSDDSNDSDFICLRPAAKRPRRMVCDDDSNSSSSFTSTVSDSFDHPADGSQNKDLKSKKMSMKRKMEENPVKDIAELMIIKDKNAPESSSLPLLHVGCEEGLCGSHHHQTSAKSMMDFIKAPSISSTALHEVILACHTLAQTLGNDSFHQLSLLCVPLPKSDFPVVKLALPASQILSVSETSSQKKVRKRIIQGDWFDSDGSDEEIMGKEIGEATNVQVQEQVTDGTDPAPPFSHDEGKSIVDNTDRKNQKPTTAQKPNSEPKSALQKTLSEVNISVLSEFAEYYESKSFVDSIESRLSLSSDSCKKNLIPGLSDDGQKHSKISCLSSDTWSWQITEAVNVLGARKLCKRVDDFMKAGRPRISQANQEEFQDLLSSHDHNIDDSVWPDELHLPVGKEVPDLWAMKLSDRSSDPVLKNICTSLGPGMLISDPTLHTDYLPVLREICRSENDRHIAKVQRRFHHYLDNIGMGLRDPTVATLVSTYTVAFDDVQKEKDCSQGYF